jgi:hypothetical protein
VTVASVGGSLGGRVRRRAWAAAVAVAAGLLATTALAGLGAEATVLFGRAALGERPGTVRGDCPDDPVVPSGPPDCFDAGHDASGNALDNLVPRNVVIPAGGSVTFLREGGNHQVGVYAPGTDVDALRAAVGAGGGFFNIDTPEFDQVAAGPAGTAWRSWTWETQPGTATGRYLVVCTFRPHLRDLAMFGWVEVK